MLTKNCVIKISLLLLFLANGLSAQFRTTDFRLLGKVESVQSVTKSFSNPDQTKVSGFLDSEQFDSVYLKFDRRRNLILRENYLDYRGKLGLFDRTVLQINPSNQLEKLETTLIQNGEEPRKISQQKKFYYIKNQLVRTDEFNSGRTSDQFWVMNASYKNGEISKKVFWMEDEIFSMDKLEYDEKNLLRSETNFHNNGSKGKTVKYEYANGDLLKKISELGNETTIETFRYDKDRLSQIESAAQTGKILRIESYDENGLLSALKRFNHKTQEFDLYRFEFEMESENNWTKCVISRHQSTIYSIQRKITYFNN